MKTPTRNPVGSRILTHPEIKKQIGKNIALILHRAELEVTHTDFAEELGITAEEFTRLTCGDPHYNPPIELYMEIARICRCKMEYIFMLC